MGEHQKRERLRFPRSPLFPVDLREWTKLGQSRFLRMHLQPEFRQPPLKLSQKSLRFRPMLESHYEIVVVADQNYVPARYFLAPGLRPQIENIMRVYVRQQRRNNRSLRSPYRRLRPRALNHFRIRGSIRGSATRCSINLTQTEAAKRLKVSQPRISDLTRGKISRFSLDTLVNMLTDAGLEVDLRTKPSTRRVTV
jgi:predicted XRE-type DNA-binding protein